MLVALRSNAQWMLVGIYVVLVLASTGLCIISRLLERAQVTELKLRIRSWWVMVIVFSVALIIGTEVSLFFFALVSLLALQEFLGLALAGRSHEALGRSTYLAVPIQYYWIASADYEMFLLNIPLFMTLLLSAGFAFRGDTRGYLHTVSTLGWGLMLTVFALSHLGFLLMLPDSVNPVAGTAGLVLYLVCLTEVSDVAQFLVGRTLGRRPITPNVSPNKTLEGFLGGLGVTLVLATLLAPWLTPFNLWQGAIAGLLIGLGGFAGDVTISAVKRDLGVKDAGKLIPGHGGVLDRVDSLIFTAPLFFHFVNQLQA